MTERNGGIDIDSKDHGYWRSWIERENTRLAEIEERGIDALSQYDLTIAYQGNHELALSESRRLVHSHIVYFSRRLEALGPEPEQQMTLFEMATKG